MLELNRLFSVECIYTAIEPIWEENFNYKKDRHVFWELVYVVDGCADVLKDSKTYELTSGEMIFHMPMEFHSIRAKNNRKLHLIVINFSANGTALTPLNTGIFHPNEEIVSLLREVIECAHYCNSINDGLKNHILSNSLERVLLLLLAENNTEVSPEKFIGNHNYHTVIKAMYDNLRRKVTVEELAEICKLSPSNLKKIFKKYSSLGVIEYFNQLKITEAMKLLNSDASVSEISYALGYSSPSYFCDAFKRHTGFTPSEYKRIFSNTATYVQKNK